MRKFIQGFAAWGVGDGIAGLITLILTFAFSGSQKPFDWLFLTAMLLSITVWFLVFQLTVETAPKDKSAKDD